MNVRCVIITLDPAKPDVVSLQEDLRAEGLDVTVFPAVDGRQDMPALQPGESIDQAQAVRRNRAPLTSSEVGCYLSHYRVIKDAYQSGAEKLCVFEDDIGVEPGLGQTIRDIENLPAEFEFVRLMGLRVRYRKLVCDLSGGRHVVRPLRGWQGTQGYIVNRFGMEKIIKHGCVLSLPIDIFYDTFWETDLKCFGVEPHVVFEKMQASSVKKAKETGTDSGWSVMLRWRIFKMLKSMHRLLYINRHYCEFRPAQLPESKPGRTERMK